MEEQKKKKPLTVSALREILEELETRPGTRHPPASDLVVCVAPCEGVFFPIRIVGASKGSDLSRNYLVLETERGILDKGTVDQERALPEVLEEVLNMFTYMLHWEGGKPVLNPYEGSEEDVARILRKLGLQVKDDRKEASYEK